MKFLWFIGMLSAFVVAAIAGIVVHIREKK
jgi:hypothetical protein